MSTASQKAPESLLAQLYGFRRHIVVVKITEVLIAATFAFFAAWLVVMVVERVIELVAWQRFALLMVGAAGFGIAFPKAVHRWVWKTRHAKSIVRLLSKRFPLLSDEILGVLELSEQNRQGASKRLIEAAIEQTAQEATREDFKEATPAHRRAIWTTSAVTALLASCAATTFFPAAAQNAWQRFLNPWTDTARFTFTKLAPLDGEMIVPYGEAFDFRANLSQESTVQPSEASASLGSAKVNARLDGNGYTFELPGQSSAGELHIKAGDSDRKLTIIPKTRPELVDVLGEVILPEYLQIPEPQDVRSLSGRFAVLEGSRARFKINTNRKLVAAAMDGQSIDVSNATAITPELTVQDEAEFQFQWRDELGLDASEPAKLQIRPISDRSPECTLQRIENRIVLWEKALRLRFSAVDDFGLKFVGIQWEGIADPVDNPNPVRGEKILFAGGPMENSIQSESVLTPKREEIPPQLLTLRLFTQDFRPGSPRVYSLPQTVHVMSAEQHVAWLAEQMKRWQSKADAIYERELALHDENKRLQSLSDEELAEGENIRRLEQQAASERDNAQRLEQAIDEGRQLVEQALQNKEMRADQVVRWADSLKRLKEIANKRMPELSRKLDELANNLESRNQSTSGSDTQTQQKAEASGEQQSNESSQKTGDSSTEKSKEEKKQSESEKEKKSLPNLNRQEDSMLDEEDDSASSGKGDQGSNKMTIPETQLRNPKQERQQEQEEENDQQGPSEDSPPEIDEVVEDQDKLLEEFRKARGSMDDLMAEFENTTFVRRLKSASRVQLRVASLLNSSMSQLFGANKEPSSSDAELIRRISAAQEGMFEDMSEIEADLNAYQSREPDEARQQILDEMQALNMRVKLEEMPLRLQRRLNGDALHRTEFWADTFDRWAEELVPPSGGGGGGGGGGRNPSLPPSIILEVMRLIDDETQLRDETRALHQARGAMEETETEERLGGLTIYQMSLQERTLDAVDDVKRLPNATQAYGDEIKKLTDAVEAMAEASSMLVDGMTGDPTVGAESAAIEALLTARRNQPNSGQPKDRGEGAGDGSESLAASESPFDILRSSVGATLDRTPRDVGAATSNTTDRVPEAYRSGLDAFRNQLRKLEQMNRTN